MTKNIFKKINLTVLFLLGMLCADNVATAQFSQYVIGGPGNELATKIVHMPDGSDVIAGYQYAISGGSPTNLDAIIMRVSSSGTIMWQKKYWQLTGTPSTADMFNDIIIANDGNLVVVGTTGRSGIYSGNHAAIIKINALTGFTMWSKILADAGTPGGEVFYGVAEYFDATLGNYYLAAVGARDFGIGTSSGLIAVFSSATGAFQYDEYYYYHPSGAEYQSAVTNATGDGIFVCGQATIGNFGDGIVFSYTPNVSSSSGTKLWENWYDFTTINGFNSSFFLKMTRYNTTLLIEGGNLQNYCLSCGSGQFIFRLTTSGTSPNVVSVENNTGYYANAPAYTAFTDNHVVTVQTPAAAGGWFDPVIWGTVGTANTVVTNIFDVNSRLYNPPVQFGGSNSNKAIFSMDNDHVSHIYMAGTVPGSLYGLNDIYYVRSDLSFTSLGGNIPCDKQNALCRLDSAAIIPVTPLIDHGSFSPTYYNLSEIGTAYRISLRCGDEGWAWGGPGSKTSNNALAENNLEESKNTITYPNPVTDNVTITLAENIKTVQLFDFSGRKISEFSYEDNRKSVTVPMQKLIPGNYLIRINSSISKVINKN